ncbi:MAG: AMP-binding protein, partial [Eubacteriales bacterium]|nr:AMP-binding protein [Eubacteriales bacterium]
MKLSFSTNGWESRSWDDYCRMAKEYGFLGIELHDGEMESFTRAGGPLDRNAALSVRRQLIDLELSIPCVDVRGNMADPARREEMLAGIERRLEACARLGVPCLRLTADQVPGLTPEEEDAAVIAALEQALPEAERLGVTLLMETCGLYADTGRLRELLNWFASDNLAALWDMQHPYRLHGESAEQTITNLGAYVRHVHLKDSEIVDGQTVSVLVGEGTLPIAEMLNALRSVNYDGFLSLEWDPTWCEELNDPDIIFPHFAGYMSRFDSLARAERTLYRSRRGDGMYVWKKDSLVDMTFSRVLDRMVEEFPDQYAIKYTTLDYTRTYSQFRDDVDRFARSLISLGVKAGDKVSVWATNVPQWYIAFWATTKIGAVLVTVNTAYKIAEAEYLLRQSDTHTLVMIENYRDSDYAGIIRELCPELAKREPGRPLRSKRLPFLRNVITVGFSMPGAMTWEEALERASETSIEEVRRRAAAVNSHDVANMQYTSGTTGFPKGVMLTHYNIVNNGKCIGDRMDLSTADRMMIQVPMFHCFGMVLAMTASMTHGSTILPLPYFSPKPALACINAERITAFHGVPTMFIALLEHEDFPKTDFSYMRTGIMAGSPCPIAVMRDVVEKMHMSEITIVYGQTEASPGCTMSSTDDPLEVRVTTVGRALPEIECRIVDPETGEELPDNEIGEFCARGYNIMKGYYKMPGATAAAIDADGWLHTGDLACRTPEGNFRITGRLKDMIIRGGENIYPKEIEEFIYTHPGVRDVQVIGVPDKQYGEEIMACIILKETGSMTEAEMSDYIKASMARHKVPRYIE